MKSSSRAISVAASAQRLDVDNRISLRYYYRIADNLIKQANIYWAENNIIDLYVMLLQFSSLITETIPYHRDYQVSLQSERLYFKKKSLSALNALEALKPDVQQRVQELNRKTRKVNKWGQAQQNGFVDNSLDWPPVRKKTVVDNLLEWPPVRKQTLTNNKTSQVHASWNSDIQRDRLPLAKPGEEQFHKFLTQPAEDKPVAIKDDGTSGNKRPTLEEVLSLHDDRTSLTAESSPMINLDATGTPMMDITREPSPPPVLAEVQV